jgi:hypothetical protein
VTAPSLTGVSEDEPPHRTEGADWPALPERDFRRRPVSLGLFLLVSSVAALMVGVTFLSPCVSVVLLVLGLPIMVYAAGAAHRAHREGGPMTVGERVAAALGLPAVVVLVGVCAYITFWATCFTVGLGGLAITGIGPGLDTAISWAIGAGVVAGVLVCYYLARAVGRERD